MNNPETHPQLTIVELLKKADNLSKEIKLENQETRKFITKTQQEIINQAK